MPEEDKDKQEIKDEKPKVDWEKKFQEQAAKNQAELDRLTKRAEEAETAKKTREEEAARLAEASAEKERKAKELEEQSKSSATRLSELETEKAKLQKTVGFQKIIMAEFPDLVELADIIPAAEDDDGFRKNAKGLQERIIAMIEKRTKTALAGASPSSPQGAPADQSAELDGLYVKAYALAGDQTKKAEFDAVNKQIRELEAKRK